MAVSAANTADNRAQKNQFDADTIVQLVPSRLLIGRDSPCDLMHRSRDEMLDQVVENDRHHHSWLRGKCERSEDQAGLVIVHA